MSTPGPPFESLMGALKYYYESGGFSGGFIPSYPTASLPNPVDTPAGSLSNHTDGNRGLLRNTGTKWIDQGYAVNVMDFGAIGDGVANDTVAIQAAIDIVQVNNGGTVIFPAGKTFLAVGLTLRCTERITIHAEGSAWLIKDASAPYLTVYGSFHIIDGPTISQLVSADLCQAIVIKNDATTVNSVYCQVNNVRMHSVNRCILVDMNSALGACYRHSFSNNILQNFTQQAVWASSYGYKFTGTVNGDSGGNDTKVFGGIVKGYLSNCTVVKSTGTKFFGMSSDGGGTAFSLDATSDVYVINCYLEYNTTVLALTNNPYRTYIIEGTVANYTTLTSGAASDTYVWGWGNEQFNRVPSLGGAFSGGALNWYAVNEIKHSIGLSRDVDLLYALISAGEYGLTLPDEGSVFYIQRASGKIAIGNKGSSTVYWNIATNRFYAPEIALNAAETVKIVVNSVTPEGAITADPGSLCVALNGGFYVKQTGTGNTGWVLK